MGSARVPMVLSGLLLLMGPVLAADPPADDAVPEVTPLFSPPAVSFADGRITVEADDVPLDELLRSISEEADVEIRGEVVEARPVTVRLDGVPIRQAVDRLLTDQNFTMRYGADGTLAWITLRGPSLEPPTTRKPAQRRPRIQNLQLLLTRKKVAVPANLQARMGGAQVTLSRFLRGIRGVARPAMRTGAMRIFLNAVERDADMRAALRGLNAQAMARFARRNLGNHGAELVRFLSNRASDPAVRIRAKSAQARIDQTAGG